ncbi:hypothetical protein PC116_g34786, partial [Phytophthora cactorum]
NGVSKASICESGDSELGSIGAGHDVVGGVTGLPATTADVAGKDGVPGTWRGDDFVLPLVSDTQVAFGMDA